MSETKVKKEPVKITVAGILAMLDAGKDREAIKAELGISHSDMALLFKNPALKGRKPKGAVRTKKAPGFILVDENEVAEVTPPVTEEASAPIEPATEAPTAPVAEPAGEALDKW